VTVWTVLLAAGSGRRLGTAKQFLYIGGQRAVDRVVRTARRVVDGVVLVLPDGVEWDGPAVDAVAVGGSTRSQSVRAGLALVPALADIVLIHDAAHPLVTEDLLRSVIAGVHDDVDGAVCALPMTQVVHQVADGIVVEVLPKQGQVLAQAPTAFRAHVLRQAHAHHPDVVEDVGLVVSRGGRVAVVAGDPLNLHVTSVEEWAMACSLAPLRDGPGPRVTAAALRPPPTPHGHREV